MASNVRNETPGPYATAAISFDLNAGALARGAADLDLPLPGSTRALLRRAAFQSRGNASGVWRGKANLRQDSEVLLTLRNGFLAGTISIGQELFEIRPAAERHVVEKLNPAAFPKCRNPLAAPAGDTTGSTVVEAPVTAAEGSVTVDLLSVYTPQARAAAGGTAQIQALLQSAVDRSNLALTNSAVGASFRLVATAEVAHNDAGNLDTDLNWVRSDPTVAALRNSAGADMVSLVVENGAGYCGLGYVMRSPSTSFAPYAFQVTARSCAVGNLSFAHEHGHNSGMEHDPANGTTPTSASYPWSFGHFVNASYRTVMSYSSECPNGCTRVAYFSNPDVTYNGYPTGVPDQRDNARTARGTLPVVALFRSESPSAPPAPPAALNAAPASATQINLAWADASGNEDGFRVERSTDGLTFTQIATTGAGVTSYANSGLAGGTQYTYRVRSFNAAGQSDPSNDAIATTMNPAPPAAPTTLVATAISATQVNLSWQDLSNNETGFRIERSSAGGSFVLIATTGANVTAFSNTGLTGGVSYAYRVQAFNGDGSSAYSNTASVTTPAGAPAAPASLTGAPQYSGSGKNKTLKAVALSWASVVGINGYNLESCLQSGKGRTRTCTYSSLANPSSGQTSLLDTSVAITGKGTYQYRLRTVNNAGVSAWAEITVAAN